MHNRIGRSLVSVTLGLSFTVLFATYAGAHAAYESSDPANDSTVSSPPSRVTAEFTEPVVDGSYLAVYDPCGARVDNGDSLVAADRITVSMSADKQGRYRVTFKVVSSVDGHPTSGEFGFTSSGGSPCPGAEPEEPEDDEPDEGSSSGGGDGRDSNSSTAAGSNEGTDGSKDRVAGTRLTRDARRGAAAKQRRKDAVRPPDARRQPGADQRIELAKQPVTPASQKRGIWDGISIGELLLALGVAALIGAAAGGIYRGIMGPNP